MTSKFGPFILGTLLAWPLGSYLGAAMNADLATSTVYEIWCCDEDMVVTGGCDEQTGSPPDNDGFDLDQTNVIFAPNGTGGYDLSAMAPPPPLFVGGAG